MTNQGLVRFTLYDSAVNTERFVQFLQTFVADTVRRKVQLIVDNLHVHRTKRLQAWLEGKAHLIELRFLPPYAPHFNPDEWLNRELATELRSRPVVKYAHTLKAKALPFTHKLVSLSSVSGDTLNSNILPLMLRH